MRSKILLPGALVSAALILTACSSDPQSPGGDGTPTALETTTEGGGDGNPGHDECLLGTWQVDVQDLADQVVGLMAIPGVTAETTGTITVEFAEEVVITYDNTLAITIPMSDTPMVGNAIYSGTTGLREWSATDGELTGEPAEHDVNIDMQFSAGGQTVPVTFPPPDLSGPGPGASYTCEGDSATVAGPSPAPTWRLTRV